MSALPTYEQVSEIPAALKWEIPPEYLDENLHMNIQHYFEMCARAVGDFCTGVGIGDDYPQERGLGVFTAEQHLRYLAEVRLGQDVSVHVRPLERSAKALHLMAFLLNRSSGKLAFTFEVTVVHVGMDSRRPADFPDDIAGALDDALGKTALDWPAPVCGVMGVRRR